ncbi:MAG: hypothetical protein QOG10_4027 [Kribbellaceae bacterium]|nr:hypothetical protein [Kribbellaceae bacterium]
MLSVAVAMGGHLLVAGGSVPLAVLPQLAALGGACWLLGEFLAGRRLVSVAVLVAVQLFVHLALGSSRHHAQAMEMPAGHSHLDDSMPMPMPATDPAGQGGITDALTMTASHLLALLTAVSLLGRAHQWMQRIRRILARLVPELPAGLVPVPTVGRLLAVVPGRVPVARRWLPSNVSRRGPPSIAVLTASS